jgi:hypothetical protein
MGTGKINDPGFEKYVHEDLRKLMLVVDAPAEKDTRLSFEFQLKDHIRLIALVDRNKPADRWYLTLEDTWLYMGNHLNTSSVGWHRSGGTTCIYFYRKYNKNAPAAFTVQHMRRFYGLPGLKRALARL